MPSKLHREQRRKLHFRTIDEVLVDLDQIIAAESKGSLRALGNWSAGEILTHLAAWIDYGYSGYPMNPPPFFIRWILRRKLKKILESGMDPGVRIPGVKEGTFGMEKLPTLAAAEKFQRALQRLRAGEPCPFHSPAFGEMSMADRIRLNLRHAELHLSFLQL